MNTADIHTLDLEYLGDPRSVASYVVMAPDGPIMIETGPGSTTDALTRGLARLGLRPEDIAAVLVTHIHFDHAGAAGWMASRGAQVYVHEFGARHLIDPSKLIASATRIYGDRMGELFGEIRPCPAEQVTAVFDGDELDLNGAVLRAIETPGHARHHHAFALETSEGKIAFVGDAAASFIAESPTFIAALTPPPEFDLEAWMTTLDKLASEAFGRIYPTHYGAVDDVTGHLERVRANLHAHVDQVRSLGEQDLTPEEMERRYGAWFLADAAAHGVPERYLPFFITNSQIHMNLMGINRYLARR